MDKLKSFFNGEEDNVEEQNGIITEVTDAMKLSKTTRIKGFIVCFIIGILLSVLGSFALFLRGGLTIYGVFYTLGNVISLASTCFLMGPVNQMKKMFAPTRIVATIMIFVAFALTLYAALGLHNAGLALLFIIIQSLAMLWYSLSYIPYARDAVKKTVEACIA
ncbi:PREDICTED: vesicle transport protein SFT2B [Ceratosolen solmsi marchali]|uniref:Vesicle transport protein n=1 Tax=Ceratosolen solmsi marchali TaxID=326594 RepID=A0AAJ7DXV1_9HYME|nr:PREDICTED: vesicle transport protein SFT2B [Ceratosolen solmsi marchali]